VQVNFLKGVFTMHADREHVISVVLNHDDWKEFVKLQPQPVNWLRERIQEMIASQSRAIGQTPVAGGFQTTTSH
jgi:hypothetical protein